MNDDPTCKLLTIRELIDWRLKKEAGRLLLPPIQRSVVWTNEQVINYWDSLLRGYPVGMMMIHRVTSSKRKGRDTDGYTCDATEDDYQLFDGQQRTAAILLGLGKGQMKENRKLWIDFGVEPNKNSGLKFQLRMTSTGQPFGYRPDAPNQKMELGKRHEQWTKWLAKPSAQKTPQEVFAVAEGCDLIDAKCAVSFEEVYECLKASSTEAILVLSQKVGALPERVKAFVGSLDTALNNRVIFEVVDANIVANQEEYVRFFGRLGQGGTRLSDDELTYSIIKNQYPEIHDRMKEIMRSSGHLASEVNLVLAALRVAKVLVSWDNANEWEVISRPSPVFVSELKGKAGVESKFKEIIGLDVEPGKLESALKSIRDTLAYNKESHPKGLPDMLLARLPHELIDVLILLTISRQKNECPQEDMQEKLRAFVLHWLLFIGDNNKAAWYTFKYFMEMKEAFTEKDLVGKLEKEGIARFLPRQDVLECLRKAVEEPGHHLLRKWADRFTGADQEGGGEALRVLSTNRELIKRALIWLQRHYIVDKFPNYSPLSERDDDLPMDLDHIIPNDIFGFNWGYRKSRLQDEVLDSENSDNFRLQRGVVGNSLGNFRWLDAPENRSRQESKFVPLPENGDLVEKPDEWNKIIPKDKNMQPWSKNDIATFQKLIDFRTIYLYEKLLTESGIKSLLPPICT